MSPKDLFKHSEDADISMKIEKLRSMVKMEVVVQDPWFLSDAYLLTWLKEKKMNIVKAAKAFRENMIWREECAVDKIHYDENWMQTIFKEVGVNRDGGPVFMNVPVIEERVGEGILDAGREEMRRINIFFMEKVLRSVRADGTFKPATLILDGNQCWMSGDLRGMDFKSIVVYPQLKATAIFVSEGYELFKSRYPGMVRDAYILNVPGLIRKVLKYVAKPYIRADILAVIRMHGEKREKWLKDMRTEMNEDEINKWLPPGAKPRYGH